MSTKSLIHPAALLYDQDFALWTAETARLLRQGRFTKVDVEHLAEEVEDMGKSQHRELFSRLTVLIQHLLKSQLQPEKRSGSWKATIVTQRTELDRLFEQSPSVRTRLRASVARVYSDAVAAAAAETNLREKSFPAECPFTPEQILDKNFYPGG